MDSFVELLKTVPAVAWSALVTAIATSSITFIGISYTNKENTKRLKVQHDHERRLRHDEVVRDRAEELYVTVKKFCDRMVCDHFPYVRVMRGELNYNDALDMTLEAGERRDYDPARIHMICDIYFSKLSGPINELVELNGDALDIREQFKEEYKLGKTKDEKMSVIYLDKINELELACQSIEKQVARAIKNV